MIHETTMCHRWSAINTSTSHIRRLIYNNDDGKIWHKQWQNHRCIAHNDQTHSLTFSQMHYNVDPHPISVAIAYAQNTISLSLQTQSLAKYENKIRNVLHIHIISISRHVHIFLPPPSNADAGDLQSYETKEQVTRVHNIIWWKSLRFINNSVAEPHRPMI